jgi:hypothetical protein
MAGNYTLFFPLFFFFITPFRPFFFFPRCNGKRGWFPSNYVEPLPTLQRISSSSTLNSDTEPDKVIFCCYYSIKSIFIYEFHLTSSLWKIGLKEKHLKEECTIVI